MNARQMGGKRATVAAALLGARAPPYRVLFVLGGFGRRDGLLDIFERQIELIRIELLRALAELHASQLLQQMLQAVILRQCLVASRACSAATSAGS
jgi:hypothetical protein